MVGEESQRISPVLKETLPKDVTVCQTVKGALGWLWSVCHSKVNKLSKIQIKNNTRTFRFKWVKPKSTHSFHIYWQAGGLGDGCVLRSAWSYKEHNTPVFRTHLALPLEIALRSPQEIDLTYLNIDLWWRGPASFMSQTIAGGKWESDRMASKKCHSLQMQGCGAFLLKVTGITR